MWPACVDIGISNPSGMCAHVYITHTHERVYTCIYMYAFLCVLCSVIMGNGFSEWEAVIAYRTIGSLYGLHCTCMDKQIKAR